MQLIHVEITDEFDGVSAPYWLSVLEHGRGPRKSTKQAEASGMSNFFFGKGLWKIMFTWMQKHHMFHATTQKGKINEAKYLTWYINKYGNQQFRNKVFVDVYTTARNETVTAIMEKFDVTIDKITMDIL